MKVSAVPRTASIVVLAALSAGAAVLNGFADTQLLNLSSFLSGFAFGGMQASMGSGQDNSLLHLTGCCCFTDTCTLVHDGAGTSCRHMSSGCPLAVQGITPAITSELFGLQNFATNYAIIQMGPALGTQMRSAPQAAHAF